MAVARIWYVRAMAFLRLGRPLFLVGGLLAHSLGVAMALYSGAPLNTAAMLWGQVAVTATQWATAYCNDYHDLAADQANITPTRWSGGSRVLPNGELPARTALYGALVLAVVALVAGFALVYRVRSGAYTLPILVSALLLAWSYSAPPLMLHSRGLGEVTGGVLVASMSVILGFYLQTGRIDRLPLLAVVPLVLLQICMLLAVAFPDRAGDARVGKGTLVVRLGATGAARLYGALTLAAYASLPLLVLAGLPQLVAATVCLGAPFALWQARRLVQGAWADCAQHESIAFWGILVIVATMTLELLAFLVLQ